MAVDSPVPPPPPATGPAGEPGHRPGHAPVVRHRRRGPAAWIAMYHSVCDHQEDPYNITVSPDRLDRQLAWLRRRGLRGVAVRELLAARARGQARGLVGLTFDDGYADFVTEALPVLGRRRCGATLFVLPGRLDGANDWDPLGPRKRLLDADGIRRAAAAGIEIASHGLTHLDLTRVTDQELRAEVHGSRTALAELIDADVQGFCYPYGTLDARVRAAVREAGYRYACAIAPDPALAGDHALPRLHLGQADTAVRLELKRRLARVRGRALEAV
ncbi:polysaccharide deacetylase family protein [Streptomyces sp. NPDC006739]|uniref:polysaccharide deacetylase family protein n=1 Tax=Streptomyces sp. NPDC006739 TaxID=3364763 RepID=UPI0036CE83C7